MRKWRDHDIKNRLLKSKGDPSEDTDINISSQSAEKNFQEKLI